MIGQLQNKHAMRTQLVGATLAVATFFLGIAAYAQSLTPPPPPPSSTIKYLSIPIDDDVSVVIPIGDAPPPPPPPPPLPPPPLPPPPNDRNLTMMVSGSDTFYICAAGYVYVDGKFVGDLHNSGTTLSVTLSTGNYPLRAPNAGCYCQRYPCPDPKPTGQFWTWYKDGNGTTQYNIWPLTQMNTGVSILLK